MNQIDRKNLRTAYAGTHILAKGRTMNTDTWSSHINNNVLIIGPSGAGKTRHYVKPNIITGHESIIVSDTKGDLFRELEPGLTARGYKVVNIDFTDLASENPFSCGYNPLDYIGFDEKKGRYSEQDVLRLAASLIPERRSNDPYWDTAARQFLGILISYVLECLPEHQHTLEYVHKAMLTMSDKKPKNGEDFLSAVLHELEVLDPGSTAVARYRAVQSMVPADKMYASVQGILSTALDPLCFDEALRLYSMKDRICFEDIGRRKTAVFLTVSDCDRSMDMLVGAFMTQALQSLIVSAGKDYSSSCLPVPVRIYLDDFATNYKIPDFDNIISVIRSREIYVSVILQSISQLDGLYGEHRARTVINNCDTLLYLGGQDLVTAQYISERINRPCFDVVNMRLDSAFLLVRGMAPERVEKFDLAELEPAPEPLTQAETGEPCRAA